MSAFATGLFVAWALMYPNGNDVILVVSVALLLVSGGWNWHGFALKRGWIKK